jgi:GDSL-like lipase/acylhydrolase family protein
MPLKTHITCIVGLCAILSSTALVFFAGIAVACEGFGGGGGGGSCPPPSASTGGVTGITSNSATLTGSVNPQGCYTEYAFEYGRSSEGYPNEVIGSAGSGTSPVSVQTYSSLGLQPSTSYHYRLSAWSSGGETTGGSGSFTTSATCSKPTVTTEAASSITPYSATMNGTVNPGGCETMYKFEWGPSSSPSTYPYLQSGYVGGTSPVRVSKPAQTLEPGQSYHFRLSATNSEGAATPGIDKPFTATALTDYVALGDSYSSGTGAGTYTEPTCWRSYYSYPALLARAHPQWVFKDQTCYGAETPQLINTQAAALSEHTKWVSYTIGGNDSGFRDVLEACGSPFSTTTTCMELMATEKNFIETSLPRRYDEVNNKIKAQAKYAKVLVLNYPRIFKNPVEDCNIYTFFREADMIEMNHLADLISEKLQQAAARAGSNFIPVDVRSRFSSGHALCDTQPWLTNYKENLESESFHPNRMGYEQGYYPAALAVTG